MVKAYLLQILLQAALGKADRGPWWEIIPEEFRILFSLVWFFVNLFVLAVVIYLAGLVVVGGKRARFSDAFIISLLGTVLSTLFFLFIPYSLIALLLSIFVWLLLIKRLYETGWLGAIAVGILAIVMFLVVTIILALIFGILYILEHIFFFAILIL
jgi:hypothetical protein